MDVKEEELQPLYDYVDSIPLSRPKRSIARDFSDGVLVAELVHHEAPKIIELHNYSPANSVPQKLYNWCTLNQKVFRRSLGFVLAKSEMEAVCQCEVGAIERVLKLLRLKLEEHKGRQQQQERAGSAKSSPQAAPAVKVPLSRPEPMPRSTISECDLEVAKRPSRERRLQSPGGTAAVRLGRPESAKSSQGGASADTVIRELRETNELLVLRAEKLEQLLARKEERIASLTTQLREAGLAV